MKSIFKYLLLLLLTVAFATPVSASDNKVDSLLQLLSNVRDTSQLNYLNDLSKEYRNKAQYDSSMYYADKAFNLSTSILKTQRDTSSAIFKAARSGLARSYNGTGIAYYFKGDYTKALEYYLKSLAISETLNDKTAIAKGLANIGVIYYSQGAYSKALEYYFKALKIDEAQGREAGIAAALGNIGNVYWNNKDYPNALDYFSKALKISEKRGDQLAIARHVGNIGNVYEYQGKYIEALLQYERGLKISEELQDKFGMSRHLGNIGNIYSKTKDYKKSLDYFYRSLKLREESGDKNFIAIQYGNIGTTLVMLKQYNEAEMYLKKALLICDSIGILNEKMRFENQISAMYEEMGKHELALEHYGAYALAKDSLFSREKENELARHELSYEFEKKETELKLEQEKRNELALYDQKKRNVLLLLIISIAIAAGAITLAVFRSLFITRKQKKVIEHQKTLVEEKQKEVLDSIYYARRIQRSLLPTEKYIQKHSERLKQRS